MTTDTDKEQFVCLNCYHVGELGSDLRCFKCQSDSVVSAEILRSKMPQVEPKPSARPTSQLSAELRARIQARRWYHIKVGRFETVISPNKASNMQEAIQVAKNPHTEWYFVDAPEMPVLLAETQELEHKDFNEWCNGKWL